MMTTPEQAQKFAETIKGAFVESCNLTTGELMILAENGERFALKAVGEPVQCNAGTVTFQFTPKAALVLMKIESKGETL